MKEKRFGFFLLNFLIAIVASVTGSWIYYSIRGTSEMTKHLWVQLGVGAIPFFVVAITIMLWSFLVMRRQIMTDNEEKIKEEAKKLLLTKERAERNKPVNIAKQELKDILKDLKELFDPNIDYSFIKLFEDVKITLSEIAIVCSWFNWFLKRFDYSKDLKKLNNELNMIISCVEITMGKLYKHVRKKGWDDKSKNSYSQIKVKYDAIIVNRLSSFFRKISEKLGITLEWGYSGLREITTL